LKPCLVLAALALGACTMPQPTAETLPIVPTVEADQSLYQPWIEEDYKFQIGDIISVRSYYDQALNQEIQVRPDGFISLLLLNEVKVLGRTPDGLRQELESRYATLLPNADINISVKEIRNREVFVGGEVSQPSLQPIRGELTLTQGVFSAGGFLPSADYSRVVLLRKDDLGLYSGHLVDVRKMLADGEPDIYLRNQDIVYVPMTHVAIANQMVEEYLSRMVPRWVSTTFGYQFLNTIGDGNSVQITP
jgi:polysaccharide export outer membrane protein